jgi:hypothetical protein
MDPTLLFNAKQLLDKNNEVDHIKLQLINYNMQLNDMKKIKKMDYKKENVEMLKNTIKIQELIIKNKELEISLHKQRYLS